MTEVCSSLALVVNIVWDVGGTWSQQRTVCVWLDWKNCQQPRSWACFYDQCSGLLMKWMLYRVRWWYVASYRYACRCTNRPSEWSVMITVWLWWFVVSLLVYCCYQLHLACQHRVYVVVVHEWVIMSQKRGFRRLWSHIWSADKYSWLQSI